jgi:hypothetical protein
VRVRRGILESSRAMCGFSCETSCETWAPQFEPSGESERVSSYVAASDVDSGISNRSIDVRIDAADVDSYSTDMRF